MSMKGSAARAGKAVGTMSVLKYLDAQRLADKKRKEDRSFEMLKLDRTNEHAMERARFSEDRADKRAGFSEDRADERLTKNLNARNVAQDIDLAHREAMYDKQVRAEEAKQTAMKETAIEQAKASVKIQELKNQESMRKAAIESIDGKLIASNGAFNKMGLTPYRLASALAEKEANDYVSKEKKDGVEISLQEKVSMVTTLADKYQRDIDREYDEIASVAKNMLTANPSMSRADAISKAINGSRILASYNSRLSETAIKNKNGKRGNEK